MKIKYATYHTGDGEYYLNCPYIQQFFKKSKNLLAYSNCCHIKNLSIKSQTGAYKVKYKMLTENLAANSSFRLFPPPDVDGVVRKTRSAYPSVRLRPNTSTYRVYSQVRKKLRSNMCRFLKEEILLKKFSL